MDLPSRSILGMRVDATTYEDAARRILSWAQEGESRSVFVANVHNVMESYDEAGYRDVMAGGDLVTPDGMPLVWGLRRLGVAEATRVYGPDLMPAVCEVAAREGTPVGLFGGAPAVLAALEGKLRARYPQLRIAFAESPPFRRLTDDEDAGVVRRMNESGARIVFVGLGAPKQERWIAEHKGKVHAVMLGVGAAFDFLAEAKRQAPSFMRKAGLEWAFRLVTEPRRLWRRYARHNPRFVVLFAAQLLKHRRKGAPSGGAIAAEGRDVS